MIAFDDIYSVLQVVLTDSGALDVYSTLQIIDTSGVVFPQLQAKRTVTDGTTVVNATDAPVTNRTGILAYLSVNNTEGADKTVIVQSYNGITTTRHWKDLLPSGKTLQWNGREFVLNTLATTTSGGSGGGTGTTADTFADTFGDGASTTFTLLHELDTRDLLWAVRRTASPYDYVLCDVQATDANNAILSGFDTVPTTDEYTLILRKSGTSMPSGFSQAFGDGAATDYTLTHSLGTRDVAFALWSTTTYSNALADATLDDTDNVTLSLDSAPALNAVRLVIQKGISGLWFAQSMGDGATTAFVVNHGLGTRNVLPYLWETASPWGAVIADIEATDNDNVTVRFETAPTTNQYRLFLHR